MMKTSVPYIVRPFLAIALLVSCAGVKGPLDDLRFGMSFNEASAAVRKSSITLQKSDQWYPRIDTYFCFIEKYDFPRVAVFLVFFEDRLYMIRYLLNDDKDPMRSYAAVVKGLEKLSGGPAEDLGHTPPGYRNEDWKNRHREIMKKGGFLSHRWAMEAGSFIETKLYAGSYYFQIEWKHCDGKLYGEAEKFKKSILLSP